MKVIPVVIACLLSLTSFCQDEKRPWTIECGVSTNTTFHKFYCYNLRYISPRFSFRDDHDAWLDEEDPDQVKRGRIMFELLNTPVLKVMGAGVNLQYRVIKYGRLNIEMYGGVKFFFEPGPLLAERPEFKRGFTRSTWYLNYGILCQLDLGMFGPFADVGYDGIYTIGTEINLNAPSLRQKRRYKLRLKKQ